MISIGKRIRKSRELLDLSQDELALLMGKSGRATVSNWENDKNEPTLSDFKKLAEVLKTTAAYLIGESPQFNEPGENYIWVSKDEFIELQRKALKREEEANKELKDQLGRTGKPEDEE